MTLNSSDKTSNILAKLGVVLLTVYMTTTLAFSTSPELNKYSQLCLLMAFVVFIMYLININTHIVVDTYIQLFFFFICFCTVSILWAQDQGAAFARVITLLQLCIMAVLIFNFVIKSGKENVLVVAIYISGLLSCAYMMGYYGIDGYMSMLESGERAGGEITNVNTIGMYMSITSVIGFALAYSYKKPYLYLLTAPLVIIALGSGSRKALVMLVAGIVMYMLFDYVINSNANKFLRLIIIGIILVAVFMYIKNLPIFATIFERFNNMMADPSAKDHSTLIRERMIQIGWEYFKEHPFSGIGIGNSFVITESKLGKTTYLHNNFIELLATVGSIGFVLYYAMYAYILKNLFVISVKKKDAMAAIMFIVCLLYCVMGYGMVSYYDKMTYAYLSIAAAIIHKNKSNDVGGI